MKLLELPQRALDLRAIAVRLIEPGERSRWEELMRAHHYLGGSVLVGRSLRYVAEYDGQWLALLGWASAAKKCAARDAWIGWTAPLQWQRISLIANNARFLILPGPRWANLASRVLGMNLARLAADWQAVHGQPVVLAETFVDPARFAGTCYRAANWIEVGTSRGFGKSNARYTEHGAPKRVLVYPLVREARTILAAALPAAALPARRIKPLELSEAQARELLARLSGLAELRRAQGQRHRLSSLLALALCAFISGARSSRAMADWVQQASPTLLRRLRCRWDGAGQRFVAPSEPTLRRVLAQWPLQALAPRLGAWLQRPEQAAP